MSTLAEKRKYLKDLKALTRSEEMPKGDENRAFIAGELTPKQKKFVAAKIAGHNNRESAKIAGYKSPEKGSTVWKKLKANDQIIQAFEAHGITPEEIAAKAKELMNCDTVFRVSEGVTQTIPDNTNRNKALHTVVEILGGFASRQETLNINTFEQRISIIQQIKENPQLLDVLKQKLIVMKARKDKDDGNTGIE